MRCPNDNLDYRGNARVQTVNTEESKTIQSDAELADIHNILRQYKEVGLSQNLDATELQFADISELTDYADAMRVVRDAEQEFMTLPSKVREIFNHNVAEFLDTAHDQEKRDALVAAGFMDAPPAAGGAVGAAVDSGSNTGASGGAPVASSDGGPEPVAGDPTG